MIVLLHLMHCTLILFFCVKIHYFKHPRHYTITFVIYPTWIVCWSTGWITYNNNNINLFLRLPYNWLGKEVVLPHQQLPVSICLTRPVQLTHNRFIQFQKVPSTCERDAYITLALVQMTYMVQGLNQDRLWPHH